MSHKITANKSILENTKTNCVFIATKACEETQCEGPNREHIEWVGELDVPVPDCAELMRELYERIKHGDQEHMDWLKSEIESFIDTKCL
jgi:hypothetical protein